MQLFTFCVSYIFVFGFCVVQFLATQHSILVELQLITSGVFGVIFGVMTAVLMRSFGWNTVLTVGGKIELVRKYFIKFETKFVGFYQLYEFLISVLSLDAQILILIIVVRFT
jgi:hypothetical protein